MAKTTRPTSSRAPIRGYDNWTVGEMQKKLGRRTRDELVALRDYEKGSRHRKGALDAIERAIERASEGTKGHGGSRRPSGRAGASRSRTQPGSRRGGVSGFVESIQRRVGQALGSAPEGTLDRQVFMDRLSEFLEHERGGAKIYELGLEKVEDEEQRERIQEFLDQTRRHEEILTGVIQELGGNPDQLSESAELDRQKSEALVEVDAEGEVGLLNFFQSLFIAELTCHMNWEFLSKCVRYCDDEEVRSVLDPHVSGIEDEEDEHVNWARKQLEECSMKMAFRSGETEAASEETGTGTADDESADDESDDDQDDRGNEAA